MPVRIADIEEHNRPRERLARIGFGGLSDAELVALVIRTGTPGRSAIDAGAELLAGFGSLSALAGARPEELSQSSSMGTAKAAALAAAFELGRRAACGPDSRRVVRNAADIVAAVRPEIGDHRREEALVVVLSAMHRVIKVERLSVGSVNRCLMPARDVLAAVLRNDGVAFAVAHTHPGGDARPSPEDVRLTQAVAQGASAVGLRFLDHVVLAGDAFRSLRALGHLP